MEDVARRAEFGSSERRVRVNGLRGWNRELLLEVLRERVEPGFHRRCDYGGRCGRGMRAAILRAIGDFHVARHGAASAHGIHPAHFHGTGGCDGRRVDGAVDEGLCGLGGEERDHQDSNELEEAFHPQNQR